MNNFALKHDSLQYSVQPIYSARENVETKFAREVYSKFCSGAGAE